MRPALILRAPEPDDMAGGGGARPTDEGDDGPDGELVTISRVELDDLRRLATRPVPQATSGPSLDDLLQARDREHELELSEAARRAGALEASYKAALLDRELATALAGRALVPGAASQLIRLWRDAFEVVDDDGAIRVVSREGRDVDRAVGDRLASPEFAHFCLPTSRGGTARRGPSRAGTPAQTPAAPRTLGEAVVRQWREATPADPGLVDRPTGWGRRR